MEKRQENETVQATPKGLRLHLGIFGRRNAGKSSLLNALTRQRTSIVSETAGTTTDPVEKPMELLPLGPVLFIDTAGIDDVGALGELRIEKTRQVLDRTDVAILVADAAREEGWSDYEESLLEEARKREIPTVVVFSKTDLATPNPTREADLAERNIPVVRMANPSDVDVASGGSVVSDGTGRLRDALVGLVPDEFLTPPPIVADLIPPGELAVLVTPIDKEAPKGRLILPEVQTLRDLLDHGRLTLVVQLDQLAEAIRRGRPRLVVTDSQAFGAVAKLVPPEIPLTSFSILFARQKGDFATMAAGAKSIESLGPNAKILIAEACSHHPISEDIGTVKIPRWFRERLGDGVEIGHVQGHDFPDGEALGRWNLVVHCGGCVMNRREILRRTERCRQAGVAVTNYGLAIAALHGILDRACAPLLSASDA